MRRRQSLFLLLCILAAGAPSAPAQTPQTLTLEEAEKIAIQNHPQIQVATQLATAAAEQTKEIRSVYYPLAYGSVTGAEAEHNSRIAAGGLNNPIIFDRYSNGITVAQLVTDFGRTHELSKSSRLHAQAEQENVTSTRADVLLRVDQAFFAALKAQAVLRVAQETVKDRQLVADQVAALAQGQLKSQLDVSFANVDLAQAQLALVQAQNDLQASFAELSAALGYSDQRAFQLIEGPLPPPPPSDPAPLIQQALQNRPEIISRRFDAESAQSYATAERDLWLPTVSGIGAAGLTPVHQAGLSPRYAAAGFNVNVPLFNGHLFGALRSEAAARAEAEEQSLRDLRNGVARDVRKAWLDANSAFQRLALTDQLLKAATQAFDLSQERYRLGLSSIVELSQAQLNKTQAEIAQSSAKYEYQARVSALNYQLGALH